MRAQGLYHYDNPLVDGLSTALAEVEEHIVRILFESGGRVSEVVGQTLGDWVARGMLQETQAFSKGSHGKRVKFLRFSAATAKLLRRYCDTERRGLDLHHYALNDYLQAARSEKLDLYEAPLFISRHRTPLTPKTFRDRYWNPACRAAGIEADVHQARHWYVTQIVRSIYETAHSEAEAQCRLRELIEYMGWKSGWETLEAYQHYFDPQRHAEIQDQLHRRLDVSLRQSLRDKMRAVPDHTPQARDWFVQGHSGDEQHLERGLRVRRIFDCHFVAVLREQDHLPVPSPLALHSEQPLPLHDVGEGVVSDRRLLAGHASGLDPVMQVDDRRARLNDGFLAHRFTCNHTYPHQAIGRSRFRDLRVRDLLVPRRHHLVALRQVHPELESVHPPSVARELSGGHLRVDHARSGGHPLHITRL